MKKPASSIVKESFALALIGLFIYLFIFIDFGDFQIDAPKAFLNLNTIFLSIVLEAIPFILLGVFVSALIQSFVSEEMIQRFLPKNAIIALFPAALLGIIFPVCECAIVPIVRRLIKKGMPLHVGIVFLVAAPILNPVVFASTYYAFQSSKEIVYGRMGLAFVVSILVGFVVYLLFKNRDQLKWTREELVGRSAGAEPVKGGNKFKETLFHASDEFFEMGKYLILGAFIASVFQTFLDRSMLAELGSSYFLSPAIMMAFAYILSLCSEADAFVAASFGGTFTPGSLLAFLVFGPMVDLKNTIMLFAFFRVKFVAAFIGIVTAAVYVSVLVYQQFIL
ncbi:permease [Metabacillus hrfriensis]|uniref:Permease n=1 Tax=Metabacillus hrfriensis TaxID=3048891 RepID=A0ACD4R9B3_9BACI|nr:permease [Metabacillus sp. CT-WN-B3]WHZ56933.1 permease [Metabacillus sp. CT-WN-B3]